MPRRPASMRHMIRPVPCQSPRDQDAVDDDLGIIERIEGEGLEARAADDVLDPKSGFRIPLPDQTGDDEGQRERVEEDGPEGILEPDLLVEHGGQQEADHQAEDEREHPVDEEVLDGDQPAVRRPQSLVLVQPTNCRRGSSLEFVNE